MHEHRTSIRPWNSCRTGRSAPGIATRSASRSSTWEPAVVASPPATCTNTADHTPVARRQGAAHRAAPILVPVSASTLHRSTVSSHQECERNRPVVMLEVLNCRTSPCPETAPQLVENGRGTVSHEDGCGSSRDATVAGPRGVGARSRRMQPNSRCRSPPRRCRARSCRCSSRCLVGCSMRISTVIGASGECGGLRRALEPARLAAGRAPRRPGGRRGRWSWWSWSSSWSWWSWS